MYNKYSRFNFLTLISLLLISQELTAQTRKGAIIYGNSPIENFGFALSMPDSNTVAISAPYSKAGGNNSGRVDIYTWNGAQWIKKGGSINGKAANDNSGFSISMADANTIAIGAPYNDNSSGTDAGHARVFSWSGSSWIQKGSDINGDASNDYAGRAVSMPDANTIAVGAYNNDGSGSNAGHVKIYYWNGSAWTQKGANINGEKSSDQSGKAISMPDANTIAIGAPNNDGNGTKSGQVRIFSWNGSTWIQKGIDIDGEKAGDLSGTSVSMPDPNTVAIGAPNNDGNGTHSGHTRIFAWNGSSWQKMGNDIDGETAEDESGSTISMSDPHTVAIGSIYNSGKGPEAGQARIFGWNGNNWQQKGSDIDGETAKDFSGAAVCLGSTNVIAVGAVNDALSNTGYVRIYSINSKVAIHAPKNYNVNVFPNPSSGEIYIDTDDAFIIQKVIISDLIGNIIESYQIKSTYNIRLDPNLPAGIYLIKLMDQANRTVVQKMVIQK